jgi:hypothetical protein
MAYIEMTSFRKNENEERFFYRLIIKWLTNTQFLMGSSLSHLFDSKVRMLTIHETVFLGHYGKVIGDKYQLFFKNKHARRISSYPVEIISLLYWGIKTKSVIHFGFLEDVSI